MTFRINGFILMILYVAIGFCLSFLIPNEKPNTEYIEREVIREIKMFADYEKFEVTAYTAGFESTGKNPGDKYYGITASGQRAWERITLACPKSMEFGTKVYIPAFENVFTCTDRGSAITEGKLDVYMEELEDALMFGRQHLEVFILP